MKMLLAACLLLCFPVLAGQMETRMYSYGEMEPEAAEALVRQWVPEGARVLVNPRVGQVMVIADPQTHVRVARVFELAERPSRRIRKAASWRSMVPGWGE